MPRAVMVLGMHRAGTSAITRVIGLLGADLPNSLMPSTSENEAGYWESNDLMVIHDEMLSSGGSKWDDWRAFNSDWYRSPTAGIFKSRILGELRKDFANSKLFVIKDPRICRFWPLWREILEEFGAKPAVVIPVRNPLEVIASLKTRDGFLPAKSCLLWLRHVFDAERTTRDLPRAVVTYDALLSDWQNVVATLGSGLAVSWPRRGAMSEIEIERFLSTRLRHHVFAPEQLVAKAEMVDWVKDAYAALIQMSETPEDKTSMARLDRIRTEFEKASMAFGVALADSEMEIAKREVEKAHLQATRETLQQRISELSDEQRRLSADAENAAAKLKVDLQSTLTMLSADRKKAVEQSDRLAELEGHLRISGVRHAAAAEEAQHLRSERDALRQRISDLSDERRRLSAEAENAAVKLKEELETMLSAERHKTAQQADRLADLERDLSTAEASNAAASEEAWQLKSERDTLWQRISDLSDEQRRLSAEAENDAAKLKEEFESAVAALSAERHKAAEQADRLADLERDLRIADASNAAASEEAWQLKSERDTLWQRISDLSDEQRRLRADAEDGGAKLKDALEGERQPIHKGAETSLVARRGLQAIKSAMSWRLPGPLRWVDARLQKHANRKLIAASGLFDHDWYLETYPDIRSAGMDPVVHYLEYGAVEGRDPSPLFDTAWYLRQNPDVGVSGLNPLVHYVRHGAIEGRSPHDRTSETGHDPYLSSQERLRRDSEHKPNVNVTDIAKDFDADFYVETYHDIAAAKVDPLEHYLITGWRENRDPTPWFSTNYYLSTNRDVATANINPFWHYITVGRDEGRLPRKVVDWRQSLLEHLSPPDEIEQDAAVADCDRITETNLLKSLRPIIKDAAGMVLSFSHTCYPRVTAGTELFISDEQKLFNTHRFAYIHLSPLKFSILINDSNADESMTWITVNGVVLGVGTFSDVARVLGNINRTAINSRILIMHSPFGQSIHGILRIFSAFDPMASYYWIHDFSSICTGCNLLRNNIEFCHAPPQDSVACTLCVFGSSRSRNAERLLKIFEAANFTVVAPSMVAHEIWVKASDLPRRAVVIKEHCAVDYSGGLRRDRRLAEQVGLPGHPVKVAFVGYPIIHKGWPVFSRLVEEAGNDSVYEFFHLSKEGTGIRSRRIRAIDAVVTPDRRNAMVELLREHEIDIVVLPPPWPETFSFVTLESLAAGCDIMTLACSGNVAANVRRMERGHVFETEDELVRFFTGGHAVELVRSRAADPNPYGTLVYSGTTAGIIFSTAD